MPFISESLVLHFPQSAQLTDEQLLHFCEANRDLRIERTSNGNLIIMSPAGAASSSKNAEIIRQLSNWNQQKKTGVVFDSSGGFTLPSGAVRAPDAAWVAAARWNSLSLDEQKKFPPLCPDFIIELMSESDTLPTAQEKMAEWITNGCTLGWLICPNSSGSHPKQETVFIYRTGQTVEAVKGFDKTISGEAVLPEFELVLSELR